MKQHKTVTYNLNDKTPVGVGLALGFQHVAAMFTGNLAVALIIAAAVGFSTTETAFIVQCSLFAAGVTTIVQALGVGPVGSKLPIVMAGTFTFVGAGCAISTNPDLGYGAFIGACIIGGLLQAVLGQWIIQKCRHLLTPVVTGAVVLAIGVSLLSYGINYAAGSTGSADFGSVKNLAVAGFVLVLGILLSTVGRGFVRSCSVFIAMIVGYLLSACLGMVDFAQLRNYAWFALPRPLAFGISFQLDAILPILILYFASMMEFVGCTTGVAFAVENRLPTDRELRRGNICDGLGSSFSALFNCAPNFSFSQNVGLISLTGVKSRFVVVYAGIILTVMAFVPKIAAIFTLIPYPVLGGACIMMFGMIVVSGIQVITSEKLHTRDTVVLAVSLGVGMGCYFDSSALAQLPSLVQTLLTGVAGTALIAILLNLLLPKKIHEDAPAAVETARQ